MNETETFKTWVLVNANGIIVAASSEDEREARTFLGKPPRGGQLLCVDGSVTMSAHISAPTVYPPTAHPPSCCRCLLPLFPEEAVKHG
jgi:hypothetical protein